MPHRSVLTLGVTFGLALAALSAAPASAAESLFWGNVNSNTIARSDLAGGGGVTFPGVSPDPFGTAADARTGRLYWASRISNEIFFAELDGSNATILNTGGAPIFSPQGIAIDPVAGRVYWATQGGELIGYAALDGSGGGTIDTTGVVANNAMAPVIDRARGRLLWSTYTGIAYANLDGSGGAGMLDLGGVPTGTISGLAISGTKVYWVDEALNTVNFANVDGSGAGGTLDSTGTNIGQPAGLTIDADAGRIYVGGGFASTISYVNLDGSGGGVQDTSGADTSGARFPILLKKPLGTGAPIVTGARDLSCSQGSWAGDLLGAFLYRTPASYAHQWTRDGTDIAGATAGAYVPARPGSYRCRVTATNFAGDAAQTSAALAVAGPTAPVAPTPESPRPNPARDMTAPELSKLTLAPSSFAVGSRASVSAKGGTTISFTLSESSTVVSVVERQVRGRWRKLRIFGRRYGAGPNTIRFSGRVRPRGKTRSLRPGRYRMRVRPSDPAGNRGRVTVRRFRVVH